MSKLKSCVKLYWPRTVLSYIDLQQKYFPSSWQSFQSSHHSGAIQPPMKIYKYLSMIWIWSNLNEPPKLHCLGQQAKDIQEAFEHCLSLFPPVEMFQYLKHAHKMFHFLICCFIFFICCFILAELTPEDWQSSAWAGWSWSVGAWHVSY